MVTSILPGATNLAINPSFETSVADWEDIGGGTTGPTSISEGYVGTKSVRCVLDGTVTQHMRYSLASRPNAVSGDEVTGGIAIRGTAGQQVNIFFRGYNSGGGLEESGEVLLHTLTANWQFVVIPTMNLADASTAKVSPVVQKTTNNSVSTTVDVDAIDIRINAPFDTYVDGDQGDLYGWNGTAHASTSYRLEDAAAGPTGQGGVIVVISEIVRSDALGRDYDDLTDYVIDGEVVTDIDRDIKTTVSLNVSDVAPFEEYDWVKVYQTVYRETTQDEAHRESLGVFQLNVPGASWPDGDGKVTGNDVTILLASLTVTDTYNIAGGVTYTAAIASLLTAAGLGERYNIPADARTLPTGGKSFPVGTSYLTIINWCLDAIGYYTLYMLPDGRVGSIPYLDRKTAAPHHTYTIGQDSELINMVDESMSSDNQYNYVRVVKTTPDGVESTAFAENDDPAHKYSTVSLGEKAGLAKVYVLKKVEKNEAADAAAMQAIADETLERASMTRYLTINALPDPHHEPHEISYVDFSAKPEMIHMNGSYYTEYHAFGLAGMAGHCTMKLRRIET